MDDIKEGNEIDKEKCAQMFQLKEIDNELMHL